MEAPQILTQIFNQRKALMTQSITKPSKLYIGKNLFTKLRERILGEEKDGLDIELSQMILGLVIEIDETNLERLEVI